MTAADQIAELNRQRAERHSHIDQFYDAIIAQTKINCVHEEGIYASGFVSTSDGYCGPAFANTGYCKHCGEPMPGSE